MSSKRRNPFSTIQFFKLFQARLKTINTFPLSLDSLHIHQDSYSRLGDEGVTDYYPFATVELKPSSDHDFFFAFDFFSTFFVLSLHSIATIDVVYDEVFSSENEAAEQLINTIAMMANGQLAAMITTRHDAPCAIELLSYKPSKIIPQVIYCEASFKMRWSEKEPDDVYDIELQRNHLSLPKVAIPEPWFLPRALNYSPYKQACRSLDSKELTPLTLRKFNEIFNKNFFGPKTQEFLDDESGLSLYKWPQYWVMVFIWIFLIIWLSSQGILPGFFLGHIYISTIAGIILGAFTAPFLAALTYRLSKKYPDNLFFRLSQPPKKKTVADSKPLTIPAKTSPGKSQKPNKSKLRRWQKVELLGQLLAGFCYLWCIYVLLFALPNILPNDDGSILAGAILLCGFIISICSTVGALLGKLTHRFWENASIAGFVSAVTPLLIIDEQYFGHQWWAAVLIGSIILPSALSTRRMIVQYKERETLLPKN